MTLTNINLGPVHPGIHGVFKLVVDLDGDTVKRVEPHVGYLHRGVEKLMETKTYMQNLAYIEKIDYTAPISWSDLYVATVEQALNIDVEERAQCARTILLELERIASHLLWLGNFANDLGQSSTLFMWASRERAKILKLLQDTSGGRAFHMILRLGGLSNELSEDFGKTAYALTDYLEEKILGYPDILDDNPIFSERTKGIGALSMQEAIEYGVSGPVLRASGVSEDARKTSPYYVYDRVKFTVPTGAYGDCFERYRLRYEEMLQSLKIIRQVLDIMPESGRITGMPVKLAMPAANQEPVLMQRELPRGEGMIYLVPDAQKPYRIALRAPSFTNLYVLPKLAEGHKLADLLTVLGSLDIAVSELDR